LVLPRGSFLPRLLAEAVVALKRCSSTVLPDKQQVPPLRHPLRFAQGRASVGMTSFGVGWRARRRRAFQSGSGGMTIAEVRID